MVAIICFAPFCCDQLVRIKCANTDAVGWLRKIRCAAGVGVGLLAVAEFYKHRLSFKMSASHIAGIGAGYVEKQSSEVGFTVCSAMCS